MCGLCSASVIELHINWPALGDETDERSNCSLERLILLIQLVASRNRYRYKLFGKWPASAHLVIEVPRGVNAVDILSGSITDCFNQAGFIQWSYLEGSPTLNVFLVIEQYHDFNRLNRISQEEGVGWVRVYSRIETTFEDVCDSVRNFLPSKNKDKGK